MKKPIKPSTPVVDPNIRRNELTQILEGLELWVEKFNFGVLLVWGDEVVDVGILTTENDSPTKLRWTELPQSHVQLRHCGAEYVRQLSKSLLNRDDFTVVNFPLPELNVEANTKFPSNICAPTITSRLLYRDDQYGEGFSILGSHGYNTKYVEGFRDLLMDPFTGTQLEDRQKKIEEKILEAEKLLKELESLKPKADDEILRTQNCLIELTNHSRSGKVDFLDDVKVFVIYYDGLTMYRLTEAPDWLDSIPHEAKILFKYRPGQTTVPHWPLWLFYWLQERSEQVTCITDANCLREDDLLISSGRSWERSAQDLIVSKGRDGWHQYRRICKHLVVLFERNGALVRTRPDEDRIALTKHFKDTSKAFEKIRLKHSDPVALTNAMHTTSSVRAIIDHCDETRASNYKLIFHPSRSDRYEPENLPKIAGFLSGLTAFIASSFMLPRKGRTEPEDIQLASVVYAGLHFIQEKERVYEPGRPASEGPPREFCQRETDVEVLLGLNLLKPSSVAFGHTKHLKVDVPLWLQSFCGKHHDNLVLEADLDTLKKAAMNVQVLGDQLKKLRDKSKEKKAAAKALVLRQARNDRDNQLKEFLKKLLEAQEQKRSADFWERAVDIEIKAADLLSAIAMTPKFAPSKPWFLDKACQLNLRALRQTERDAFNKHFQFGIFWPDEAQVRGLIDGVEAAVGPAGYYPLKSDRDRFTGVPWSILNSTLGISQESQREVSKMLIELVRKGGNDLDEFLSVVPHFSMSYKSRTHYAFRRSEVEDLRNLEDVIRQYKNRHITARKAFEQSKPLSILCFGEPGAGKSTAVKMIAREILGDIYADDKVFNLSQIQSRSDLVRLLQEVRDLTITGKVPLVLFDEFDSRLNDKPFGWLPFFLAPMEDGEFQSDQLTHSIGGAIFVFVGSLFPSVSSFEEHLKSSEGGDLREAKGRDFLSRVIGRLSVGSINPVDPPDSVHMIQRAMLFRSMLREYKDLHTTENGYQVRPHVVNAFINADKYIHNTRSMQKVLQMCSIGGKTSFDRADLPALAQLSPHVEGFLYLSEKG